MKYFLFLFKKYIYPFFQNFINLYKNYKINLKLLVKIIKYINNNYFSKFFFNILYIIDDILIVTILYFIKFV